MNTVRARGIVFEDDNNGVSDLGPNQRAQDAKVRPRFRGRFQGTKAGVGVFAEPGFAVHSGVRVQLPFGAWIIL
jgi:hypothetical protein